uniref:Leucine rich repeat and Ig domain containing 2b n=1 Tax=Fundulus heteroclitus TaxID=8078 RepID=A0A3Q2NVM8_FUNHE
MLGKRDTRRPARLRCHLLLGGAFLLLLASSALSCPARCECSAQTKSVSCHRKRLPSIPEGVPIETRALDLSKNKLRLVTAYNFSSFLQLEDLDLSDNLISVVEPGCFHSNLALRSLNLRSNQLMLVAKGVLTGLTNLTHLDLSHNRLLVFISQRAFTGLLGIQSLTLERSNLTVVPTDALSHLHNLIELHMRFLSVSFLKPFSFKRLTRLRHLEMDFWPLLETLPPLSLHGLNLTTLLCLGGNPLVCDCRLLWLLSSHRPASLQILDIQPECSAPQHLLGKSLRDLKEPLVSRYMTCTKPRIGPNATQLLMADEGQPARLSCTVEGAPRPSVVWITPHRRYLNVGVQSVFFPFGVFCTNINVTVD